MLQSLIFLTFPGHLLLLWLLLWQYPGVLAGSKPEKKVSLDSRAFASGVTLVLYLLFPPLVADVGGVSLVYHCPGSPLQIDLVFVYRCLVFRSTSNHRCLIRSPARAFDSSHANTKGGSQHGGELQSRSVLMRSSGLRPGLPWDQRKKT